MTTATRTDAEVVTSGERAVRRRSLARERAVAYDTTPVHEGRERGVVGTTGATAGRREPHQARSGEDATPRRREPHQGRSGGDATLAGLLAAVDRTIGRLHEVDLDQVDPAALGEVVRAATRATRRLEAFGVRAIAALDRRRTYEDDGYRSTSDWLAGELRVDPRMASAARRTARELTRCPRLADAFAAGEISTEHVAVATAATRRLDDGADHDRLETTLVADARTTDPRQLARRQRERRHAERAAASQQEADRQAFAARAAGYIEHPDGGARFWQELTAGDYELHRSATRAYMTADPDDLPDDQRRSWTQRLYDASIELTRRALLAEDTPSRTGTPVTGLVIVDLPTLERRTNGSGGDSGATTPRRAGHASGAGSVTVGEGDPELSGVALAGYPGPISAGTVRRMLCDARISRVVTDGASQVLDVGRASRTATAAQHRALIALWHGCARCGAPPAYTEAHHIEWWDRDHGATDLANLLPLCWACHSAVHHAGLTIEVRGDGSVVFTSRRGTRQHRAPP